MSELVVEIIEGVLGEPKKHYKGKCQISFDCPVCSYDIKSLSSGDGKGNLEVNYEHNIYKCWACCETHNTHGTLYKLIKKYGTKSDLKQYRLITPDIVYKNKETDKKIVITGLPKGYISLSEEGYGKDYKLSMEYLKKRKINLETIKKYNIGYCSSGEYSGRIIFPSYDIHDHINYFIGRSYSKYEKLKYKNPDVPKCEIIFNEGKINWDSNIYLVEGVFDHIVVPNSIPMLGKVISDDLFRKIVKKSESKIIILLDSDAFYDSLKLYKKLNSTKLHGRVMLIKIPEGYDISDIHQKLGKTGVIKVLLSAQKIKESLL